MSTANMADKRKGRKRKDVIIHSSIRIMSIVLDFELVW